jgi:hypothetical protein
MPGKFVNVVLEEDGEDRLERPRKKWRRISWRETFCMQNDWVGHILYRNCFLEHGIEGKIDGKVEGTRNRGRRPKQLLDEFKVQKIVEFERRSSDCTLSRTRFGRGCGPV